MLPAVMLVKPGTAQTRVSTTGKPAPAPEPDAARPSKTHTAPAYTPSTTPAATLKNAVTQGNPAAVPLQLRVTGTTTPRIKAPWTARSEEMAATALQAAGGKTGDARLAAAMGALLAMPEVKNARVSLHVQRLDGTGTVPFTHNTELPLNPASNSKLATATYALGVLGPDHRFATAVLQDGAGNVYLKGGFDPSLTSGGLLELARALRASGVKEVSGDLCLDNSRLTGNRRPRHFEEFGDEDWDYLANPEALSVDKNLLELTVRPGRRPGDAAGLESPVRCFELRGAVTTVGPGEQFKVGCDEQDVGGALVRNPRGQAVIDVKGTIAADYLKGKSLVMKSPAPVESTADRVAAAFAQAGITLRGNVRVADAPAGAKVLHTHQSAPLKDLVRTSIATSNAFDHEMYCLAASAAQSPDGTTSIASATARMTHFLASVVGLEDFRMDNASGLGDANRLSGGDMVALLRNAKDNPRCAPLLDGLARPGGSGTLKTRMLDSPAEGHLRAKTGTLRNAVALSGTLDDRLAFSILVNGQGDDALPRTAARAFVDAAGMVLASV